MKMYEDELQLDLYALGREIKRRREAKGWTQEYLGQLIDRTSHTIMYKENRGQCPSLRILYKLVKILDIPMDQIFSSNLHTDGSERRKRVNLLLDSLDERELAVIEATAEGLKSAREIKVSK